MEHDFLVTQPPPVDRKSSLVTSLGAFGVSAILHVVVLLLVGSYVIFEEVIPRTPFTAVGDLVSSADAEVLPEPPSDVMPDLPETPVLNNDLALSQEPAQEAGESTSSDILVASSVNPTFSLPPATGPVTAVPRLGTGGGSQASGTPGASSAGPSKSSVVSTLFGSSEESPSALTGRFYDASRRKNGDAIGGATMANFSNMTAAWVKERGKASFLRDLFWESKTPLYAKYILIPGGATAVAFESFGEKPATPNPAYLVHYSGRIATPEAMTFRFNVNGNDCVIVLIDGKPVAIADLVGGGGDRPDWRTNPTQKFTKEKFGWESPEELMFSSKSSYNRYTMGDWLTWGANEFHKIDILIGDAAVGGDFFIFVEVQGKRYDENEATKAHNPHVKKGIPILPPFKTDRVKIPEEITASFNTPKFEERGPVFVVQP